MKAHSILTDKHIVVLYGGPGAEREVSIRSGQSVANALQSLGLSVVPVEMKNPPPNLPDAVDLVVNMIHGTYGEDGDLQRDLDRLGIPYTGEGEKGSRLAFDKIESKRAFDRAGISTPAWEIVRKGETTSFEPPFVVKAPRQGSSVGVHIIRNVPDYPAAVADCLRFGEEVLIEKFIEGRELTVGVLGSEALPVIEIHPKKGFYTYENKYTKGATEYLVPAPIDEETTQRVLQIALRAHQALGLEIYSRVDVLLDAQGALHVLEINTIPGMTETSLLPKAAASRGMGFPELCAHIALLSLERSVRQE